MKKVSIFIIVFMVANCAFAQQIGGGRLVWDGTDYFATAQYNGSNLTVISNRVEDSSGVTEAIADSADKIFSLDAILQSALWPQFVSAARDASATATSAVVTQKGSVLFSFDGTGSGSAKLKISNVNITAVLKGYKYIAGVKINVTGKITLNPLVITADIDLGSGSLSNISTQGTYESISVDTNSWLFDIVPFLGNFLDDYILDQIGGSLVSKLNNSQYIDGLGVAGLYAAIPSGKYIAYGYDIGSEISGAAINFLDDAKLSLLFERELRPYNHYDYTVTASLDGTFVLVFESEQQYRNSGIPVCTSPPCSIEP